MTESGCRETVFASDALGGTLIVDRTIPQPGAAQHAGVRRAGVAVTASPPRAVRPGTVDTARASVIAARGRSALSSRSLLSNTVAREGVRVRVPLAHTPLAHASVRRKAVALNNCQQSCSS